jgi:hypothetical protein
MSDIKPSPQRRIAVVFGYKTALRVELVQRLLDLEDVHGKYLFERVLCFASEDSLLMEISGNERLVWNIPLIELYDGTDEDLKLLNKAPWDVTSASHLFFPSEWLVQLCP